MRAPGLNAGQVIVVEIAWPPRDVGELTGECDDVLARAAANLHDVSGSPGEVPRQNATNGLMVAVKGRRVEPPVGLAAAAILAEFNDVIDHNPPPGVPIPKFVAGPPPHAAMFKLTLGAHGSCESSVTAGTTVGS